MTEIYIISGFLGAGKTTLIQKLLSEHLAGKRVALVENDFGEVNVDAALLKKSGVQVRELNAGCICCTLTGDFIAALGSLLKTYQPEVIIIEPSGVGKLSDVEKACLSKTITPMARIARKLTVVDAKRCARYLENFGEFFEDQVAHADAILFSRMEPCGTQLEEAMKIVEHLNPEADVYAEAWSSLTAEELLGHDPCRCEAPVEEHGEAHACCTCCGHHDHDHDHHHHHACGHHHHHEGHGHAHETFDTVTIRFSQGPISVSALAQKLSVLERPEYGMVLRAKGILRGADGFLNLQFLPGDLKIEETEVMGNELCIIGRALEREKISQLFAALGGR